MINKIKKEKLDRIYEKGIDPYPSVFKVDSDSREIKAKFKNLEKGEHTKEKFSIAGRIMQNRPMGKACFMNLLDKEGKIQLYFRQDDIGKEEYKKLKLLDRNKLVAAQTPQGFLFSYLLHSHLKAKKEKLYFTDDLSLVLNYYPKLKLKLLDNPYINKKITTKEDIFYLDLF